MDAFLMYIIKSAVCFTVLFVPFMLLLRREKSFRTIRVILLSIICVSMCLPLVHYSLPAEVEATMPVQHSIHQALATKTVTKKETSTDWMTLLGYVYIIGVLLAVVWHMKGIVSLWRIIKHESVEVERLDGGVKLLCHTDDGVTFSWMKTIVMSEDDLLNNKDIVIEHEMAHIRLYHSWDKILATMMQTVQWFNPFVWFLTDTFSEIHEYEADSQVVSNGVSKEAYQMLLIRKITSPVTLALVNGLNMTDVRQRIMMMNSCQSTAELLCRQTMILPAIAFIVLLYAAPKAIKKEIAMPHITFVSKPQVTERASQHVAVVSTSSPTTKAKASVVTKKAKSNEHVAHEPSEAEAFMAALAQTKEEDAEYQRRNESEHIARSILNAIDKMDEEKDK